MIATGALADENSRAPTPSLHGTSMNRSFAYFPHSRRPGPGAAVFMFSLATACVLAACATLPPPTGELAAAQQAVTHADGADADQYAPDAIAQARSELAQAQAALSGGKNDVARTLADAATADADFAFATSSAASTQARYAQHRDEVTSLRQRLQMDAEPAPPSLLDASVPPSVSGSTLSADTSGTLSGRLQVLDADPALNSHAAYERLRARQALDALAAARGRDRPAAARLADRRVAIAEIAARTQATSAVIDQLERQRSDLLVEASRQDADRARQEAEQARVQAQMQAEEAQRLREQAAADAAARAQAEQVITDAGVDETARLKAARDREAALARQEAALMAGSAKAPVKAPAKPKSTKTTKPRPKKP